MSVLQGKGRKLAGLNIYFTKRKGCKMVIILAFYLEIGYGMLPYFSTLLVYFSPFNKNIFCESKQFILVSGENQLTECQEV